jgi:hypothetical protein
MLEFSCMQPLSLRAPELQYRQNCRRCLTEFLICMQAVIAPFSQALTLYLRVPAYACVCHCLHVLFVCPPVPYSCLPASPTVQPPPWMEAPSSSSRVLSRCSRGNAQSRLFQPVLGGAIEPAARRTSSAPARGCARASVRSRRLVAQLALSNAGMGYPTGCLHRHAQDQRFIIADYS